MQWKFVSRWIIHIFLKTNLYHSKFDFKKILSVEAQIHQGLTGKFPLLSFTVHFKILHFNLILNSPNG